MQLLTETAVKYDIPPEILKAIAMTESGIMQLNNGEPNIAPDGGIGIMQVTTASQDVDQDRLMNDTAYNIEIGAQILEKKWNLQANGRIPMINDGNPRILENWYFAIMAYNGLSAINDPNKNENSYQARVYQAIKNDSQLDVSPFPTFPIEYDGAGNMVFPEKQLNWKLEPTETTQMFLPGDKVYVMNSFDPNEFPYANLRSEANLAAPVSSKQAYYTELEITDGPYIGLDSTYNHFVMYQVKGADFTGYIASSNLRRMPAAENFKKWPVKQTSDTQKKWTIKLSESANPATVSPRNVYVTDESGNGVFTQLTYHPENRSITVEPQAPYETGKTYSLRIKNLMSGDNTPLKDKVSMDFTIVR